MAPIPVAVALAQPPFAAPSGLFSTPTPTPAPEVTSPPGNLSKNIPIISLSLAFLAFLLICLSICCCSYHRARTRFARRPTPARRPNPARRPKPTPEATVAAASPQDTNERSWLGFGADGSVAGLGLQREERGPGDEEQLPPYE